MGSLTSRGRALVVVAFVLSAALCGSAAVALVVAGRDDAVPPLALPSAQPGLPLEGAAPSASPSASPSPVVKVSPTPTVTRSATPGPTASASPSAKPSATSSPGGDWTGGTTGAGGSTGTGTNAAPLRADATLDPADGNTTIATVFHLYSHATDGEGVISLRSLSWGDGTSVTPGTRGTACSATAPADCRDFEWTHKYAKTGRYVVTLQLQSGVEIATLKLTAYVNA